MVMYPLNALMNVMFTLCLCEYFVLWVCTWRCVYMRVPHYIVCHAMCIHCIFPIGDLW